MIFITNDDELKFTDNFNCLYFYRTSMFSYKKIKLDLDIIEKEYNNINYLAVDVDYFKVLCKRFDIKSAPTILIFNNSYEIKRILGIKSLENLKKEFESVINGE